MTIKKSLQVFFCTPSINIKHWILMHRGYNIVGITLVSLRIGYTVSIKCNDSK